VWLGRTSWMRRGWSAGRCWEKFSWAIDKAADSRTGRFEECGDGRARCLEHANLRRAWHRLIVASPWTWQGSAVCIDVLYARAKATVRPAPG
jgi:hypothetical protein